MADQRKGTWRPGAIVWRESATPDLAKTTAFYTELLGWTYKDSPMGDKGVYRHWQVNGQDIGGGFQITPEMKGMPAHWAQYISIENVDGAAEAVKANGGRVNMGPMDIPNVGRAVYCADPQGANFVLFRDSKGDAPATFPPYPVGAFCWETLTASDKKAAVAFYQKIVGWKVSDFFGNTVFGTSDTPEGGVADVQEVPAGAPCAWMSHVVVKNLAQSRDRVEKLGGRILEKEIVVPTVGKMALIADSVGAVISLYEAEPRPA